MNIKKPHTSRSIVLAIVFCAIGLMAVLFIAGVSARPPQSPHKIYVAFGFHGNLYHSFRNDTNDENGFGKDIRVIRHIIASMDRLNEQGIPAKAVWDFDNLFSLQERLPQYAPGIIDDIRRRIADNGDEAILMSYNNGLVSAMNERELTQAVRWAISNPWQSGVQDVFGTYTPIVRPQEMMTTPGTFSIYKQFGIQAVALYYSATPFDAFRVFSRPLTRAEAHNPILYQHPQTGEEMVIIPSYHIGDLVEHVSLRNWVEELRLLQEEGKLNHDALIFINFDADSEFWTGVDLPWVLEWLPNTDGIEALVREIKDLSYVRFTGLQDYLQNHPPVGSFYFSQDTADGSFNGYNSWAEKARVSPQWTEVERSRRLADAARKAAALLDHPSELADIPSLIAAAERVRLRVLSTTHFGMATPHVAPQRQQAADELIAQLRGYSDEIERRIHTQLRAYLRDQSPPRISDRLSEHQYQWLDTLLLLQPGDNRGRFLKLRLPDQSPVQGAYMLAPPGGKPLRAINCGPVSGPNKGQWLQLYVPGDTPLEDGIYHLYQDRRATTVNTSAQQPVRTDAQTLTNGIVTLRFDPEGRVEGIYLNGVRQAEAGSLIPYLHYDGRRVHLSNLGLDPVGSADPLSASVRLSGTFPGLTADERDGGWADYTISLPAGRPWLILRGEIHYPATDRNQIIKAGAPELAQQVDMRWREVAPAEIRFAPRSTRENPSRIFKRNYLGIETGYALDYFRHSAQNLNLDNVNNHITESYVGIVSGGYGMAIATDTSVQANFAYAPLKLSYDAGRDSFQIRANPFGTYHGRQYRPPTWGNGQGYEMTLHTGEHLASAAPTYNGTYRKFELLISFFEGKQMPDRLKEDLLTYAHPPEVVSLKTDTANDTGPAPLQNPIDYTAAYDHGSFNKTDPSAGLPHPSIPLKLKIKVLWANVRALFDNFRL